MNLEQEHLELLKAHTRGRALSEADLGNISMVRAERFRLITARMPAQVRRALGTAVRAGVLGRRARSGKRPEAFFHPDWEHLAIEARAAHELGILRALAGVVARPGEELRRP